MGGGTGSNTVEGALNNLGIIDYIVEEGNNEIWKWVKYNSGRVIIENMGLITSTTSNSYSFGVFLGGNFTLSNHILPFSVKNLRWLANGRCGNGIGFINVSSVNQTTLSGFICGNNNPQTDGFTIVTAYITGYWK